MGQMNNEFSIVKEELKDIKNTKNKKSGNFGRLIMIFFCVLLLVLVLIRIFKVETTDSISIPVVKTTHIYKDDIRKEASVIGMIMPSDTYYVVNKVAGEITKIYVENGQRVKKGDVICEIDNSKQIEQAFIQYDTSRKSFERYEKLYKAGDISKQSYEQAKAQYDSFKLAYDTQVEYASPVAVGDGVIENTNMTKNVSISTGTVLCYITSEDAKEIQFGITERVLSGVNIYDEIKIEKQGKTYKGTIIDKANLINQTTGLFNIKATIDDSNNFASGIMAKVTFTYEYANDTNVLKRDLVYYDNGNPFVYVVTNEGKLTKKFVELGITTDEYVEILSGVSLTDNIVSTWNNSLAEGVTVEVLESKG